MRIVRRADYIRMPWKNGKGLTEEVAAFPAGSDTNTFDWRISIAHVDTDGPFSLFPDIDRSIALLEGNGLALDLPDSSSVALTANGSPFSFSGDVRIASRNLEGPTVDLNIMTRRGRFTHGMQRQAIAPGAAFTANCPGWILFTTPAQITLHEKEYAVERFDALSLDAGDSFVNIGGNTTELLIIWIGKIE